MGLFFGVSKSDPNPDNLYVSNNAFVGPWVCYDPLTNDAQAMALVKKLRLELYYEWGHPDDPWCVCVYHADELEENHFTSDVDINRAICECVHKMHTAKAAR